MGEQAGDGKVCNKCLRLLPFDSFHKRSKVKFRPVCKECTSTNERFKFAAKTQRTTSEVQMSNPCRIKNHTVSVNGAKYRVCKSCSGSKEIAHFVFGGKTRGICKECYDAAETVKRNASATKRASAVQRAKEWTKSHPVEAREARQRAYLKRSYGITTEWFNEQRDRQMGVCDICGNPLCQVNSRDTHIDHCHNSGKLRGILCASCNKGLGHFMDSAHLLESAAIYIRKHNG